MTEIVFSPAMIATSIAIGLIISLIFTEFLGIAAGGMVVPGYMALFVTHPVPFITTLLISLLTYFIVHSLSSVMIIYGRRRTVLMILFGFLLGSFVRTFNDIGATSGVGDVEVVGYIIPGLIAIWIDRQGLVETCSALVTSSVIIRFLLIMIVGGELIG